MDTLEVLKKVAPEAGKIFEQIEEVDEEQLEAPKISLERLNRTLGGPEGCVMMGELTKVEKKVAEVTEFYENEVSRSFGRMIGSDLGLGSSLELLLDKQGLISGFPTGLSGQMAEEEVVEMLSKMELLHSFLIKLCKANHEETKTPFVVSKDFRIVHLPGLKQAAVSGNDKTLKQRMENSSELLKLNMLVTPPKEGLGL